MKGVYSQRKDLTGLRFGRLSVVSLTSERRDGRPVWNLLCDCGRERKATSKSLTAGLVVSCGCHRRKDLAGIKFGRLTAVRYLGKKKGVRSSAIWECLCDCGSMHIESTSRLTTGSAVSCGCIARTRKIHKDLTGHRFGRLTVVAPAKKRSKQGLIFWACLCDCGSTRDVLGSYLRRRAECPTTSCKRCACKAVGERRSLELVGKRFGRLTVVRKTGRKRNNHNEWECLCDCGKSHFVSSSGLTCGGTQSCGCLASESVSARNVERFNQDQRSGAVWLYESHGKRIRMRSSWEVVFARWLDDNCEPWEYEPKSFALEKAVRYTPDFFLPSREVWVEVKGFMSDFAKKKIDAFKATHRLVVVRKRFISKITGRINDRDIASLVRRVAAPMARHHSVRVPCLPYVKTRAIGQMRLF
jgi:hypothetical protein